MKISNFLDPIDPKHIREFNIWLKLSTICIGICLASIIVIETFQLWHLLQMRALYKKYSSATAQFNQIHEQKNKLAAQEQELKNKITTITSCSDKCALCIDQLKGLCKTTPEITVSSYTTNEHSTTIAIKCPTIKHAQQFITTLSALHKFNNLLVASVQPDSNSGLLITLKTN